MSHTKINRFPKIDGFSGSTGKSGEIVKVVVQSTALSIEPLFYVYAIQFLNFISSAIQDDSGIIVTSDSINKLLLVIHQDNSADLYINDFEEEGAIRVNRAIQKGEPVLLRDIADIESISFKGIEIVKSDKVVYITRFGFIFGLFFDFTQELVLNALSERLASLKRDLYFGNHLQKCIGASTGYDALIFTEGKTDAMHLEKAMRALNFHAEHALAFDKSDEDFGDEALRSALKAFSRKPNEIPIIGIFDRDNPKIIKDLERNGEIYCDWGNNVYSLILPVRPHRSKYQNISIEMYYTEQDLHRQDGSGKRIHFDNEISKTILPGNELRIQAIRANNDHEYTKKVFDTDVEKIVNAEGRPCAMSKTAFADLIVKGEGDFSSVDFSAFSEIFEIIRAIISK